ncbi:MAG: hypothetical protein M1288_03765 [Actinobacteria bacterium]|jgi:hypothetical protein|nr:hypothetical protein [Actinomycetota bacterium]
MSKLETVASQVLPPLILGQSGSLQFSDQRAIAAWALKTIQVALLVSSDEERAAGHGLPTSEYRILHERSTKGDVVPATHLWAGKYEGTDHHLAVWVTPLTATIDGITPLDFPQAYVFTIILGQLILHGVRFTAPMLDLNMGTRSDLAKIWPIGDPVTLPRGKPLDDARYFGFVKGDDLLVTEPAVTLRPWLHATELPTSIAHGPMVALPTICGEHHVFYPESLVAEARRGHFYAFHTACECPENYLVMTASDGAHFEYSGSAETISEMYESTEGTEVRYQDGNGVFVCKRVLSEPRTTSS